MSLGYVTRGQGTEQRLARGDDAGNGGGGGRGFSGTLDLDGLEPLLALLGRIGGDAVLHIRAEDGTAGHLRYAAGELAAGSFGEVSGPSAMERLLALQGGDVEMAVIDHGPPPPLPREPALAYPSAPGGPSGVLTSSAAAALGASFAAGSRSSGVLPPALRPWLWAVAPALAVGLWIAVELAGRLTR